MLCKKIFCLTLVASLWIPINVLAMSALMRVASGVAHLSARGAVPVELLGSAQLLSTERTLAILLTDTVRRDAILNLMEAHDKELVMEARRELTQILPQFPEAFSRLDPGGAPRLAVGDSFNVPKLIAAAEEEERLRVMINILQEKVEILQRELRGTKEVSTKARREPFLRYNIKEDALIFGSLKLPGIEVEGFQIEDVREKLKALWLKAKPWIYGAAGGTGGAVIGGPLPEKREAETDMIPTVTDEVFRSVEIQIIPLTEEASEESVAPEELQQAKELLTRPLRRTLEQVVANEIHSLQALGLGKEPHEDPSSLH